MVKKEPTTCENCKCENCCGGKCLWLVLTAVWCVAAIIACIFACKASQTAKNIYNLNVLSAGWIENFNKMNELYASDAYIKYATEQTDGYVTSFMSAYGNTDEDASDDSENTDTTNEESASLETLKSIAVNLWTDSSALQACIDEWKYTQAVNDMMNQANELFGVNGTPGNVIVDTENGNYILVSGAYPTEDFVSAINEYKNGAENFVAWWEEVKSVVKNMLTSTPIRGKKDARFTIIEYTELLCPYCQRHSQAGTINAVIEQFPDEVNSVSRHFIIHGEEALQLASAMECVAELNPDAYHKTFEEAFAKWL